LTVGKGALSLLATLGTIFVLIVLFLLEGPKMRQGLLKLMRPERAAYYTRVAGEISQSATGYALGNLLTSLIAGVVVFAGALQVITRELWQVTAWPGPPDRDPPVEPGPAVPGEQAPETGRQLRDGEQEPIKAGLKAPTFDLSGGRCA